MLKKIRKSISLLLIISLFLTCNTPVTIVKATQADQEITKAISLSFVPKNISTNYNKVITYSEYCRMIRNMLKYNKLAYAKAWDKVASKALSSDKNMTVQEGMLALFYAGEILGKKDTFNNWVALNDKIGEPWDDFSWEYPQFPDWKKKAYYTNEWDSHIIAAYFFSLGEKSNISGKLLFDYDSKANSMHPASAFTRKAAIHSVLRLYESTLKQKERVQESWDKQLLTTVDQRKDVILHSTTDVKYTGKAYYVSNSGNDVNDGLSEETSWSTLDKVNTVELQPGDAVFFERNGLWRGRLIGQKGVTYSAYGTGDKPKIYGSPENGAGAEKWSLLKGSKNIWVFYKDIPDCGSIVFNEGQCWAEKQLVYWDGKKYVYNNDKKTECNVKELPNMFFYNEINLSGRSVPFYIYGENIKGKLYLRCDAGNPGEIYQSIEFLTSSEYDVNMGSFEKGDNVVDNLCFKYGGNSGIRVTMNSIVQNCEISWVGGSVLSYDTPENGTIYAGDGICAAGKGNIAINNYIHHIYDYGMNIETGFQNMYTIKAIEDITFQDNIVEYCNGSIIVINWEDKINKTNKFKNITFKNNYCMYSGYGWSYQAHQRIKGEIMANSVMFFSKPNYNEGIYFNNNIFYLAKYALVYGAIPKKYWPEFSGNTYVQNTNGLFYDIRNIQSGISDYDLVAHLSVLGDKTANIIKPN